MTFNFYRPPAHGGKLNCMIYPMVPFPMILYDP